VDPGSVGLTIGARIAPSLYYQIRSEYERTLKSAGSPPTKGTVNCISVYISFADDSVMNSKRKDFVDKWESTTGVSVTDYYKQTSYEQLFLKSYHFPASPDTLNISYKDIYPRNYYAPYSGSNPNGYSSNGKAEREHGLLKRAIEYIDAQVPDDLDLDMNNDNVVDNVCFILQGTAGEWSSLLWPHAWSISSYVVTLNGLRVRSYFLMLESGFSISTVCHELGHVFGAPDLYHYDDDPPTPDPVGQWCLMKANANPPQGICGFLRYKYNKWIPDLPEITETGTYTLKPLTSPTGNLYKIKSPYSRTEYFVLEYRRKEGRYETSVPGTGLVVYRINPGAGNGNAGGPPDEVYVYRPGGSITSAGALTSAAFGISGRKEFNDHTVPYSFLWNSGSGGKGGIDLSNITLYTDSLTFDVTIDPQFPPTDLIFTTGQGFVNLDWNPCLSPGLSTYNVYRNNQLLLTTSNSDYKDQTVQEGLTYSYYITATYTGEHAGESVPSNTVTFTPTAIKGIPYIEDFETDAHGWTLKGYIEGFMIGNAETLKMQTANATRFIGANSYEAGEGIRCSDYAISPRLNLAGKTKVALEFDYAQKRLMQIGTMKLVYRQGRYGSWVTIADLPPTGVGGLYTFRKYSAELPAGALTEETQFAFRYDDGQGVSYGAAFDNFSVKEVISGIESEEITSSVNLYPNPALNSITVTLEGFNTPWATYRVIDAQGREIRHFTRTVPSSKEVISLEGLNQGAYRIVVETPDRVIVKNFIKVN
jgi:M6 family metalloprotease-like protein